MHQHLVTSNAKKIHFKSCIPQCPDCSYHKIFTFWCLWGGGVLRLHTQQCLYTRLGSVLRFSRWFSQTRYCHRNWTTDFRLPAFKVCTPSSHLCCPDVYLFKHQSCRPWLINLKDSFSIIHVTRLDLTHIF